MSAAPPLLSFGQAFVAPDRRRHRSSMSVTLPDAELLATRGACALISDSTSRNPLAKQAGDISVRGFIADYFATPDHWDIRLSANRVLRALNSWCFAQSRQVSDGGYVSSVSAMVYLGPEAHLFHVGDTRVFRLRGAEFEQITRDHVVDIGGYRYPSRALGMDECVDVDYACIPLNQGDIFLFTTQAVQGTLMPSDYVGLIRQGTSDLDAACERLAETARQRAQERGYGGDQFCFQLVRIDALSEAGSQQLPARIDEQWPVPPELGVGDMIDGLVVREVLSRTTHSRVYRVWDATTERDLVMKAPSPELSRSAYLEHFRLQQSIVRSVNSPQVVALVEPSTPRHYLYYLMERVEGVSLSQWLHLHPEASLAQRLAMGYELGKAIQALHQCDLIHQQVHPDAVMVEEGGRVVLVDFSACHPRESDRQRRMRELLRRVGMTEHSAPEYALDDEVGRRSDQFSLASTLYWLLSGDLPYAQPMRDLVKHTDLERLEYHSLRCGSDDIPARLDDALRRALSAQREMRYRRLSEFLEELRDAEQPLRKTRRRWLDQIRLWKGVAAGMLVLWGASWLLR